ncbi:MAG: hypothetical protein JW781_10865 [Deltaproteobacteria bacterium]|nr:hypothetical protein [Candidatus Anaeroferrophillacea bacterium]
MNAPREKLPAGWWGPRQVANGSTCRWHIGGLELQTVPRDTCWEISHRYHAPVGNDEPTDWRVTTAEPTEPLENLERVAFRKPVDTVELLPLLADRPLVSRLTSPLVVPGREKVSIYLNQPLWIGLRFPGSQRPVREFPAIRLSDTWFGADTIHGELCYATLTFGRLHLEELVPRPHRAITPIVISNHSDDDLRLERLSVPVPYLSIFISADAVRWTETLTATHRDPTELVNITISKGIPKEAGRGGRLLAPPRKEAEKGVLSRALGTLFG